MKRNFEYHMNRSKYDLGGTGGNYTKYVLFAFGISVTWVAIELHFVFHLF
jgi:hypothetical protein